MASTDLPPPEAIYRELCRRSFLYFADQYCQVLSETAGPTADWIPFRLWPAQQDVAKAFQDNRLVVVLKARQLGLTWLALAFALWLLLLYPVATVLLFSRRDDEAIDLLARLKQMFDRLPPWLRVAHALVSNDHEFALSNGSRVKAFPTTAAGDSYTATLVIVDEADLIPDLDGLIRGAKPTIDAAGRLLLISRANKTTPESPFKRIYRAARSGASAWTPIFLPWNARPGRDQAWYEAQRRDGVARTGSEDDLHEQYPATDAEALAPRSADKRLPAQWLTRCYQEWEPDVGPFGPRERPPAIPGLDIYRPPVPGRRYIVGGDPAEGNPGSDPSAAEVLDLETGEEVAALAGRFEPATFAAYLDRVGRYYNHASLMVERNNHGHAVLLWLRDNSPLRCLCGHDQAPGWLTTTKGKALLYDGAAEALRDGDAIIHGLETFSELAGVEGATQRAPEGQHDDRATAFVLALAGRKKLLTTSPSCKPPTVLIAPPERFGLACLPPAHDGEGYYERRARDHAERARWNGSAPWISGPWV